MLRSISISALTALALVASTGFAVEASAAKHTTKTAAHKAHHKKAAKKTTAATTTPAPVADAAVDSTVAQ